MYGAGPGEERDKLRKLLVFLRVDLACIGDERQDRFAIEQAGVDAQFLKIISEACRVEHPVGGRFGVSVCA